MLKIGSVEPVDQQVNFVSPNVAICSSECIYLYINHLQMIQNYSVIRILAQYKWKASMKICRKESQLHFYGFCFIFLVSLVSRCMKLIYKILCVYIIYIISHSLWSFNDISVWFQRSISSYQNAPWKRFGSMWFVRPISTSWPFLSLKWWGAPTLLWVKKSPFHVLWTWF